MLVTNQIYTDPETEKNMPLGGNILAHNTKIIIELINQSHGRKKAVLLKHRSLPTPQEAAYRIVDNGIESL